MLRMDSSSIAMKDCKDCKHYVGLDEMILCLRDKSEQKTEAKRCENERKGNCGAEAKYFEVKDKHG